MVRRIFLTSVSVVGLCTATIVAAEARPNAPVSALPSWTGFYIGLNAGGAWGNSNPALTGNNPNAAPLFFGTALSVPPKLSPSGFIGGGQFGYNAQNGQWVFGGEVDFSGLSAKADASVNPFFSGKGPKVITWSSQFDWLATARLRGGFLITPTTLVYATGGLAVTHVRDSVSCVRVSFGTCGDIVGNPNLIWSDSRTLAGGTVGGGIETMLSPGWTARVEYLFASFGKTTPGLTSPPSTNPPVSPLFSFDHELNLVRFAVNYKFHP